MVPKSIQVGELTLGGGGPLFVIAGPCVIQDLDTCLLAGSAARAACQARGLPYIFKASFDKANRTSAESYRGPGIDEGLSILAAVRSKLDVPVLTDVHETAQVAATAQAVDVLQIPAFLCRQTDLIAAAAESGKALNIKKGPFLAPEDMQRPLEKALGAGARNVMLTERGTCFGYHALVSDMRALPIMRAFGYPVVFDATHSVQRPGARGCSSGGDRDMIAPLARAAVAAGADGLFIETHPDPSRAPSDADVQLPLAELPGLLDVLSAIDRAVRRKDA